MDVPGIELRPAPEHRRRPPEPGAPRRRRACPPTACSATSTRAGNRCGSAMGGNPIPTLRRRRSRSGGGVRAARRPATRGCSTSSCSTAAPPRATACPSPTTPSSACSSPISRSASRSRSCSGTRAAATYGFHLHQAITKEFQPEFGQTCMEILGPLGQIQTGEWAPLAGEIDRIYRRSFGNHAGGTSQVKRMVVATRGLGLPAGSGDAVAIDLTLDHDQLHVQQSAHDFFQRRAARRRSSGTSRTATSATSPTSGGRWPTSAGSASRSRRSYGGSGGRFLDLLPDLRGDGPLPRAEPAPRHRRRRGRDVLSAPAPTRSSGTGCPPIADGRCHHQPRGAGARRRVRPRRHRVLGTVQRRRLRARPGPSCWWSSRRRPTCFLVVARTSGDRGADGISLLPRRRARRRHLVRRRSPTSPASALYAVTFDDVAVPRRQRRRRRRRRLGAVVGGHHEGRGAADRDHRRCRAGRARDDEPVRQGPRAVRRTDRPVPGRAVPGDRHPDRHAPRRSPRPAGGVPHRRGQAVRARGGDGDRVRQAGVARTSTVRPTRCTPASRSSSSTTSRSTRGASKFWENNLGDARYYQEQLAGELEL